MISYNPKDWILFVFRFHKADTVRKLFPLIVVMCLYSWLVVYLENRYFKLSDLNYARNVTMLHNLLGFAISMLLVSEITRFELDHIPHPEIPNFDHSKHVPNQIAGLMMTRVTLLYKNKVISGEQLILLNEELRSFLDICGACERIKNTPIPYSYSGFIKKFIFFYIITLPIGLVASLGMITIPVVAFIFYVLASLEIIAQEIEEPFGKDTNDLPMERLYDTINRNCKEILS